MPGNAAKEAAAMADEYGCKALDALDAFDIRSGPGEYAQTYALLAVAWEIRASREAAASRQEQNDG